MIDDLELEKATHLVDFHNGNAAMLCETHAQALQLTCAAAALDITIYHMPEDELARCQACHLASLQRPLTTITH
jgi:hypothetical protein